MTDYQDALVLENLDLVNWVIRTRISIPNRPLLTYDDFYAIGCEAICRAALKYQPDITRRSARSIIMWHSSTRISPASFQHISLIRDIASSCTSKAAL